MVCSQSAVALMAVPHASNWGKNCSESDRAKCHCVQHYREHGQCLSSIHSSEGKQLQNHKARLHWYIGSHLNICQLCQFMNMWKYYTSKNSVNLQTVAIETKFKTELWELWYPLLYVFSSTSFYVHFNLHLSMKSVASLLINIVWLGTDVEKSEHCRRCQGELLWCHWNKLEIWAIVHGSLTLCIYYVYSKKSG